MIKKITLLLFIVLLSTISYHSISSGSGPVASMTNAPITSSTKESNCTSCHGGSLITQGTNWNNISLTSNFTGNGYIPDSTYTVKIAYSQSGIGRWGFQATVLDGSNNMAGTLSGSGRVMTNSGSNRTYIQHNSSGTSSTSTNTTEWSFTWKAPNKNVGPVMFYLCLNAANGDAGTSGDQIYAKTFTINPSSLLPVANASSADSVTCSGSTISMKGSSTQNATSWSWTFPGFGVTPNISTAQNPQVKYNNSGNFLAILTTKNSKGFSKPDTLKIVVKVSPPAGTSPNPGTYTICKGDSMLLRATGTASNSYTWSTGAVTQSIYAKDTGNYTVTASSSNGCSTKSGIIRIQHHKGQTMSLTRDVSNDTVCFERDVKLTASGTTNFDTIIYYTSFGLFQKTTNNPHTIKFNSSMDLFARGKDSNNCITPASNKFNFVVKNALQAPVASCIDKTASSFEISWSAVSNAIGYELSLDSGKTWINPSSGKTGLSHKVLGFPQNTDVEVWLKTLDVFPCNESEVSKVICGSIPCSPLSYDIVWDKDVCKGSDINFKIRNLSTNYFSLKIDNGLTFKDTVFKISSDFSRTYQFELTDSNNLSCPTIKRSAAVKVWEIPMLEISSSNSQNIFCEGSPAGFDVVSKGMEEYNFFLNGTSQQKGATSTWTLATPKNMDSVWVVVTNGPCVATSGKLKLGVKPLPSAQFTYSFSGKTATFTPSETGTAKFYWDFGDGGFDTVSKKPVHTYAAGITSALVKVLVIDEFGCRKTDSSVVQIPGSIKNSFKGTGINVYPQPAKNSFFVEIPSELINSQISLMDANGRIVMNMVAGKKETEVITTNLPNGIYLLMVAKDSDQFNGKVIINR